MDLKQIFYTRSRFLAGFIDNAEAIKDVLDYLIRCGELPAKEGSSVACEVQEPLISMRDFCNTLIIEGNMILFPHNVAGLLTENPDYFEGCFKQNMPGAPIKVRRNALLAKLRTYESTSRVLKKYLTEEKKYAEKLRETNRQD